MHTKYNGTVIFFDSMKSDAFIIPISDRRVNEDGNYNIPLPMLERNEEGKLRLTLQWMGRMRAADITRQR